MVVTMPMTTQYSKQGHSGQVNGLFLSKQCKSHPLSYILYTLHQKPYYGKKKPTNPDTKI